MGIPVYDSSTIILTILLAREHTDSAKPHATPSHRNTGSTKIGCHVKKPNFVDLLRVLSVDNEYIPQT